MEGNKRIEFAYTWAGEKLSKKVYENKSLLNTSHYMGAFLHDGTQVNQIMTGEGRIVREINATTQQVQYIPEYHMKDHLGNTRLTFRPGADEVYLATMETENDAVESQQFRNLNTKVPSTAANVTTGGNEAARLNKDKRIRPAILLPVLSGDVIEIETRTYFEGGSFSGQLTAAQFLALVANAYGGVSGGTESQKLVYQNITGATGIAMPASGSSTVPYAHLNYILFDKDYQFLDAGFKPVPSNANGSKRKINFNPINISESGYIYVFVSYSNLSGGYVYFDDLKVTHEERLSVVQADDYYPFGMTMAGLEYRRGDIQDNDYLYNGKELQNELGLDWYDYGARMYDAAVGRFFTQDRFAEKYLDFSPYQYTLNNPIKYIDINGDSTYTYDVSTGTLTMISDVGGNEQQIVNFVDADGKAIMIGDKTATSIIDGESVYVTGTREGYLVSSYDPLEGISADYNSQSGYEYSATDLIVRHYLKGTNLGGVIAGMEATGNAQPLAKDTHYENYVERWETDKAFYYGLEEGYFTNVFPAGAGDALADGQKALSNASKNSKAFSPNFSQVQSPIQNQWNRFLNANKGSGKSIQQLAKEYNKLMKGK